MYEKQKNWREQQLARNRVPVTVYLEKDAYERMRELKAVHQSTYSRIISTALRYCDEKKFF